MASIHFNRSNLDPVHLSAGCARLQSFWGLSGDKSSCWLSARFGDVSLKVVVLVGSGCTFYSLHVLKEYFRDEINHFFI